MPLIVLVALGGLAGVAAASLINQPLWVWMSAAALALVALFLLRRAGWTRKPLLVALAFALGAARHQAAQPVFDSTTLAHYNDTGIVTLEGVVWDEPEVRDADAEAAARTHLRVRAERVILSDGSEPIAVNGLALVYAPRFSETRLAETGQAEWRYGDRVRVTGSLETPPVFDDFSYRDYLARFGIYSQVRRAQVVFLAERQGQPVYQIIFDFKARALAVLKQLFPEPHAALLQGILLGVEAGIPPDIKDAFRLTGTSHIVAISGFNISILVAVFMALFSRWLGPNRGALFSIVAVAAYTVLVGASASVVRAAIMGSLGLIALRLGRRTVGLNTLAAAALAMVLWNPLTLWDVGFQLSAAATLGLILYAEPMQAALQRVLERRLPHEHAERLARFAADTFLLTFAAQLTTLPLIAYTFGQLSLISLLANALILPAQPAVMVLGLIALSAGLVWLPLGQLAAWLAYPFTVYTLALVQLFARVPGAAVQLDEVAPALVLVFYALLFAVTWLLRRPVEQRPAWWGRFVADGAPLGGIAALSAVTFFAWGAVFAQPEPGRLRITALEAGAIAITTPSGAQVLVDGGSSGAVLRGLADEWPPFSNDMALLVMTTGREVNAAGLPDVLARYRIAQAVAPQGDVGSAAFRAALESLSQQAAPLTAGLTFDLGDGVRLSLPGEGVVRVERGDFSLVAFTAPPAAGPFFTAPVVLIGAGVELDEVDMAALAPRLVVIMGDAAQRDMDSFAGHTLLHTDQRGAVTVETDGQRMWVVSER
jgi:competence protein ComEC